ncbi:MAG TPA: hypothetical protein VGD43_17520 [Micromonospora sp.]
MLENLDSVDWARLSHAYGPATDVPDQIRALRSPDPETRRQARWELYGNIFHQGTRYEATAHAVPFLLELLAEPATPDRADLLQLLVSIAIGYDESWLPETFPVADYRRVAEGGRAVLDAVPHPGDPGYDDDTADYEHVDALPEEDQRRLYAHIELAAYDAVRAGVPLFRSLLDGPDPALRMAAAYALGWFPEDAAGSLPALTGPTRADDAPVAATALVSVGLLGGEPDPALLADPRPLVRWATAIGRARALGAASDQATVEELLTWAAATDGKPADLLHFDGDLAGYAGLALRQTGPAHTGRTFEALLTRIPTVSGVEALPVVAEALRLAFPQGRLGAGTPFTALTGPQRRLVRVLATSPATWLLGDHTFGNFSQLVGGYGLPSSSAELLTYAGGPEPADDRGR